MKRKSEVALQVFLLCAGLAFPSVAHAQRESKNQGNVFGTVGGFTQGEGTLAGGGIGYERLLYKGLAAGFDFGFFGLTSSGSGAGGMVFTANGSYHFRNVTASRKLAPFGTAGLSSIAACGDGCGSLGGMNFGGGFNYWSNRSKGFRVEFRDHLYPSEWNLQMLEVRVGFSF